MGPARRGRARRGGHHRRHPPRPGRRTSHRRLPDAGEARDLRCAATGGRGGGPDLSRAAAVRRGAGGGRMSRAVVSRRRVTPNQVLAVASLGAVLAFVDATIVNVAFPDIRKDFADTDLADISWVLNAYNIVFAAFILAAGRVADLLGRKRLFEWGIVVFTLASVLCALAPSVELLVAARIVQALGAAITVPASLALVLEGFPERERAHGVALWSAAAALAAGLGPSLGGILVEAGGWRLAFLVNLPIGLFALRASKHTLVESRAPGRRMVPDLIGALLLAGATTALTLGIIKGQEWGWGSPRVLGCFGVAVALGSLFVERCRWHRSPMLDLTLLRIRSLAASNVITVVAAAGFYAYVLCNVLFLTTVWGYSVLEAGLAITPGPFVAAAVARPASKLAARVGAAPMIALGALVWAGGVTYLVTVVGTTPDFVGQWLPGMFILGLGAGITFPVVGSTAVAEVTGGRFATATGINSIARQLGAVLGVALLVAIVGTPVPTELAAAFDRGWTFAAACFAFTAVAALAVGRVAPATPEIDDEPDDRPPPLPAPSLAAARGNGGARRPTAPRAKRTPSEFLRNVPMFASLPDGTLEHIAARSVRVRLRAGDWLFHQGEPADGVYVVAAGRLDVVLERDGEPELLRVLGPDSVVGELALLADSERSASIRARRDSELLGPSATSVIVLIPAHEGLPLQAVVAGLVEELGAGGSVARLDGPAGTPLDAAAEAELLERYEHEVDHVVLVAEEEGDWRDFCLRHCDRAALLAGDRPVPGSIAQRADLRGCDLLFAAGESGAARIGEWLDV